MLLHICNRRALVYILLELQFVRDSRHLKIVLLVSPGLSRDLLTLIKWASRDVLNQALRYDALSFGLLFTLRQTRLSGLVDQFFSFYH